jgi:hypothetical protein
MAGQVLNLADSKAEQIAQQAQNEAAALREAAERDAVGIRETAARDAAEMRAKLDSMLTELSRVAAYLTESYGVPPMTATAPALPGPALPGAVTIVPDTSPAWPDGDQAPPPEADEARPDARPSRPHTTAPRPAASPARRDTRPGTTPVGHGRPGTAPAGKPKKKSRQQRASRIAIYTTALAVVATLTAGAIETGMNGVPFFLMRENGIGQTNNNVTDQSFLSQQQKAAQAAHHTAAPTGRHHKTSTPTAKPTTNG